MYCLSIGDIIVYAAILAAEKTRISSTNRLMTVADCGIINIDS